MTENQPLLQIAFGVRYRPHFALEDNLGSVVDHILDHDRFGVHHFPKIGHAHGSRQLIGLDEAITITREDAVFDSKKHETDFSQIHQLGAEFTEGVWESVWKYGRQPAAIRFGCLITFELPEDWLPVEAFLGIPDEHSSEFALRYSHRLPMETAIANLEINDYHHVIYQLGSKQGQRIGTIDYQHFFDPPIESKRAFDSHPFSRFVGNATSHFKGAGWAFFRKQIERLSKAA
ncbi:MAG: hypothetical protein KAU41_05805 [Deltaproteobacteria bacterium]|jgi:hypothetical protein|nr:hypothetical protein [Deltaproteobacteria bacterium]